MGDLKAGWMAKLVTLSLENRLWEFSLGLKAGESDRDLVHMKLVKMTADGRVSLSLEDLSGHG